MLLIIRNMDGCQTYACDFEAKRVWAGVLTYPNPKVMRLFERHLKAATIPSHLLELLGPNWTLIDGFLRADQSELDLFPTTDPPTNATPHPPQEPHQQSRT